MNIRACMNSKVLFLSKWNATLQILPEIITDKQEERHVMLQEASRMTDHVCGSEADSMCITLKRG